LEPTDVWLPLSVASPELFVSFALTGRYSYWLETVGRLKPGSDATEAAAQATLVWRRVQPPRGHDQTSTFVTMGPIQAARGPGASAEAKVSARLGVLSVILLLIACANVANLLLARATARRQEMAVRLALGAGRSGLLRQAFVESLMLAGMGGIAAVLVVLWAGALVRGYVLPHGVAPGGLDGRTLAFATILTFVIALASGFLPALQASRPSVTDELKAGAPRGSARRSRAQTGLLVAQVALTLVLVVGAGLFVRSLGNVLKADLGYDTRNVLVARVDFHGSGYKRDQAYDMYRRLLDRARTLPEIQAAALTQAGPLTFGSGMSVVVPGRGPLQSKMGTSYQAVSTDYFTTLGSRLTRGRGFMPADRAGGPKVAVMGATMARLAFPGEDAIGKCVMLGSDKSCWQVVGVAEDATQWSVTESPWPMIFIPLDQDSFGAAPTALYIRTRADASTLVPLVWRELQAVNPGGPYVDVTSLHKMVDPQYRPWRLGATMLGLFGGLALLLSGLGLYGVLAYVVGQRTREIGVRVALGANRRNLLAMVLGEGLRIAAAGVVVGALASLALGKLVASLLYGVSPHDPWVLATSAAVLLAAAMLACVIPARRAATVDPMEALRYE
jgi:predicted permease